MCADDFGLAPGVDAAILDLAEAGRISAISCMTTYEWESSAKGLLPWREKIDLGLHLSVSRHASSLEITRTLREQVSRFETALGKSPDFIDGHRHIHQHPKVGAALLAFLLETKRLPYVRNTFLGAAGIFRQGQAMGKTALISAAGFWWKRKLLAAGIPTNEGFTGVYRLKENGRDHLAGIFARFAESVQGVQPVWMVHPGFPDELLAARDRFTSGRVLEHELLKQGWLVELGIEAARFSRTLAEAPIVQKPRAILGARRGNFET